MGREDAAEMFLRRAVWGAVSVGESDMRDAAIERAAQHRAAGFEHVRAAEILPRAKADRGQIEPAVATAAIGHPPVIAIGIGGVWRRPGHDDSSTTCGAAVSRCAGSCQNGLGSAEGSIRL